MFNLIVGEIMFNLIVGITIIVLFLVSMSLYYVDLFFDNKEKKIVDDFNKNKKRK